MKKKTKKKIMVRKFNKKSKINKKIKGGSGMNINNWEEKLYSPHRRILSTTGREPSKIENSFNPVSENSIFTDPDLLLLKPDLIHELRQSLKIYLENSLPDKDKLKQIKESPDVNNDTIFLKQIIESLDVNNEASFKKKVNKSFDDIINLCRHISRKHKINLDSIIRHMIPYFKSSIQDRSHYIALFYKYIIDNSKFDWGTNNKRTKINVIKKEFDPNLATSMNVNFMNDASINSEKAEIMKLGKKEFKNMSRKSQNKILNNPNKYYFSRNDNEFFDILKKSGYTESQINEIYKMNDEELIRLMPEIDPKMKLPNNQANNSNLNSNELMNFLGKR